RRTPTSYPKREALSHPRAVRRPVSPHSPSWGTMGRTHGGTARPAGVVHRRRPGWHLGPGDRSRHARPLTALHRTLAGTRGAPRAPPAALGPMAADARPRAGARRGLARRVDGERAPATRTAARIARPPRRG